MDLVEVKQSYQQLYYLDDGEKTILIVVTRHFYPYFS